MKNKLFFGVIFAVVIIAWSCYPAIIANQYLPDWATRGQFGDSFGALNTLFSGLALAGLAINIYLQSVQLKKLEKQEQENSKRIDIQVETQSLTAILNYYNSEIERVTRILFDINGKVEPVSENLHRIKYKYLVAERDEILAQLRSKIALPEQGKSN